MSLVNDVLFSMTPGFKKKELYNLLVVFKDGQKILFNRISAYTVENGVLIFCVDGDEKPVAINLDVIFFFKEV